MTWLHLWMMPLSLLDPADVGFVSRDPGLPAGEGAQPPRLEEGLLPAASLWPLLLHQGSLQGQSGPVCVELPK